jgi:hypothetical protein
MEGIVHLPHDLLHLLWLYFRRHHQPRRPILLQYQFPPTLLQRRNQIIQSRLTHRTLRHTYAPSIPRSRGGWGHCFPLSNCKHRSSQPAVPDPQLFPASLPPVPVSDPPVFPTVSQALFSPTIMVRSSLLLRTAQRLWPSAPDPQLLPASLPSCISAFLPPCPHVRPTAPDATAPFQFDVDKLLCLHISYSKIAAVAFFPPSLRFLRSSSFVSAPMEAFFSFPWLWIPQMGRSPPLFRLMELSVRAMIDV